MRGWYWVAGWDSGVPHYNSCNAPVATPEEAKKEAQAYIAASLANNIISDSHENIRKP